MVKELFHQNNLLVYNTLSRQKEKFVALHPPFVGMYACGPTVYSEPHLGNCRSFTMYDIMYRYLIHLGYKVRYVRNITDAGHVESTSGAVGDRISEQAKIEQAEPMEIVQKYSVQFHRIMDILNCLPPSIEPTATGHIVEQIEMTKKIIENGYAYETEEAIYFDVEKYAAKNDYTILSGRNLDESLNNTRELDGQQSKRGRLDFALMIKAKPEHIMRWPSPWGDVYPGWHIECSAMSEKYLGKTFDIHCGGMDLIPTHHTNEVAQCIACNQIAPAKYWLHPNMLTVNGQKMSKSLGNSFLPAELFDGSHPLLDQPYSPMTVRFSMLQAHYRSTLDFSNDALKAAEKGYKRLMKTNNLLSSIIISGEINNEEEAAVNKILVAVYDAMNNDFNSAQAIAELYEGATLINTWADLRNKKADIKENTLSRLKELFNNFLFDIFGLKQEDDNNNEMMNGVMNLIIEIRNDARNKRDFDISDKIRDGLNAAGIKLKDGKDGTAWEAE
ncbi:MAG: cysteine--tRNA ligase [Chitinophagales bacterium]